MSDYIPIRKSQIPLFKSTALYFLSNKKEGVLYKKSGENLAPAKLKEAREKGLYIHKDDRESASSGLYSAFNETLARSIVDKGVKTLRILILDIAREALTGPLKSASKALPETIEMMFKGFSQKSELLDSMIEINTNSDQVFEHSVNV
ncbi:MAG: diguanylate cyclase, partial [Desulfobacteraceae bacterium]|nr:diguanylate cyclase [Desulfobacteraceae bacterium]